MLTKSLATHIVHVIKVLLRIDAHAHKLQYQVICSGALLLLRGVLNNAFLPQRKMPALFSFFSLPNPTNTHKHVQAQAGKNIIFIFFSC